jgi:hypothetical protein
MRHVLAALLSFVVPSALPAQVVHGIVRDSASGAPAAGVLVSLVDPASGSRRVVLTDEDGRFTVAAPGAGRYALEAKRIGVRPQVTAPFELAAGEARDLSLTVAPVVARLAAVRVSGKSYCAERMREGAEAATLWEEVRAALTAARITRDRRGFPVTIATFRRTLDPSTGQIRSEERSERTGMTWDPFLAVAPSALSAHGYVVDDGAGNLVYLAPDVDVLLSDLFVRDHCFHAIQGRGAKEGMIGLAFEPMSARRVADIAGVLWLDSATRELRRLEYKYTRMPIDVDSPHLASYIDYARLPSGAWIVHRWAIRMPRAARAEGDGNRNPLVPSEPSRVRLVAILEEGGEAVVGGK